MSVGFGSDPGMCDRMSLTFDTLASGQTGNYNHIEHTEAEQGVGAQRIIDSGSLWQRLKRRLTRNKKDET